MHTRRRPHCEVDHRWSEYLRPPPGAIQNNSERLRTTGDPSHGRFSCPHLSLVAPAMPTDQGEKDEMRKIVTIAIIIAAAAITTTWSVSTVAPGGPNRGLDISGGGGSVPMRSVASW
jgi:hypothetical protein